MGYPKEKRNRLFTKIFRKKGQNTNANGILLWVNDMAKKVTYDVKGVQLTAKEKGVYDKVMELGTVNYNEIAEACGLTPKAACATLARLERTHGLLRKNEPVRTVTYEVAE